jgi:hypothetical protein
MSSTIIVPPIRAPLTDPRGGTAGRAGRGRIAALAETQTTREWYLFFEKLARGLGRLDASVNQGTHEERLATNPANVPDGALWVETDRGNVVYQVQQDEDGEPVWVYLAGTMAGTLTPDERPADLGEFDTGFMFAATDTDEIYQWDGTAWVDITPVTTEDNSVEYAKATSVLTLTTTAQVIPGCSIVLSRAGKYLVVATFDFAAINDPTIALIGGILGVPGQAIVQYFGSDIFRATVAQQWMLTAGVGTTVQLSAYKSGGTGSSQTMAETTLSVTWIAP